jgi:hypothetical protein
MAEVSAHCRFISEGGLFRAGASRTCQFKSPARQRCESWPLSRLLLVLADMQSIAGILLLWGRTSFSPVSAISDPSERSETSASPAKRFV